MENPRNAQVYKGVRKGKKKMLGEAVGFVLYCYQENTWIGSYWKSRSNLPLMQLLAMKVLNFNASVIGGMWPYCFLLAIQHDSCFSYVLCMVYRGFSLNGYRKIISNRLKLIDWHDVV